MPLPTNFRPAMTGYHLFGDRLDAVLAGIWAAAPDDLGLKGITTKDPTAYREILLSILAAQTGEWDPYTASHQAKVASLSAAIALEMKLDSATISLVRAGGEVHDVGKNIIPSELLSRPGTLSSPAHEILGYHPLAGYEILIRAGFSTELADVAMQHHERLDGSGYPYGLMGDDIPLPARIVAVADLIDAVAYPRPYHSTPGLSAARAIIDAGRGVLFDSDVVTAANSLISSGIIS